MRRGTPYVLYFAVLSFAMRSLSKFKTLASLRLSVVIESVMALQPSLRAATLCRGNFCDVRLDGGLVLGNLAGVADVRRGTSADLPSPCNEAGR